jgi:hypothetical protein
VARSVSHAFCDTTAARSARRLRQDCSGKTSAMSAKLHPTFAIAAAPYSAVPSPKRRSGAVSGPALRRSQRWAWLGGGEPCRCVNVPPRRAASSQHGPAHFAGSGSAPRRRRLRRILTFDEAG